MGHLPEIGMFVCDCRYKHQRIVWVDPVDQDTVRLEDGHVCSFIHCCDTVPHSEWEHPELTGVN